MRTISSTFRCRSWRPCRLMQPNRNLAACFSRWACTMTTCSARKATVNPAPHRCKGTPSASIMNSECRSSTCPGSQEAKRAGTSLRLYSGGFDDFAPFGALFGDERSKFGRGVRPRHDTKRLEALGSFRPLEIGCQRGVELINNRPRCAGVGEKALPAAGVITRHGFIKGRHAWQLRISLRRERGEDLYLAGLNQRQRRREIDERHRDVAAGDVGERGSCALVWNMANVGSGHDLKLFSEDLMRAADADRRVCQ